MSAVNWIESTSNSNFKSTYDDTCDKISEIRDYLDDNDCDLTYIDELKVLVDDSVNKTLEAASSMSDKITDVVNGAELIDTETKNEVMTNLSDKLNKILSGDSLTEINQQLDEIIDDINSDDDSDCDDTNDSVRDVQDTVKNVTNNIVAVINDISEIVQTERDALQLLTKAAGLINCVADVLVNDTTDLASNLETMKTDFKDIATTIKEGLENNINKQDLLMTSKLKISENVGLVDKYDKLKDDLEKLF